MNRAREQLLARARFPLQQDGGARGRRRGNGLHETPNLWCLANDRPLVPELHDLAAERGILASETYHFQRLRHRELEPLRAHRLGDVVDRSRLDRRDGVLDRGIAREHDERDCAPLLLKELEELESGQPRHAIV